MSCNHQIHCCHYFEQTYLLRSIKKKNLNIFPSLISSLILFPFKHRSKFLTYIIFLFFEEVLLTFLARQVYWQHILSIFVWENLHFSFTLKDVLQIQNSSLWCCPLNFNYFTWFSSCLHGIWGEVRWNSYLCFPIDKVFLSSGFFHLWLSCSQYNMLGCSFWGRGLFCLVFSELSGSMVWCLTLIWVKLSVIIPSTIASVPLSSLQVFTVCKLCLL